MKKTSALRTDLSFMEEAEMDGWLDNIYKHMHMEDIERIYQKIGVELARYKDDLWRNRMVKMCDKCNLTYPFHIVTCECGNQELRVFQADPTQ